MSRFSPTGAKVLSRPFSKSQHFDEFSSFDLEDNRESPSMVIEDDSSSDPNLMAGERCSQDVDSFKEDPPAEMEGKTVATSTAFQRSGIAKRKSRDWRVKVVVSLFLLSIICTSGALLGTILSKKGTLSSRDMPSPEDATTAPTTACIIKVDPFVTSTPDSFTVRATIGDLCTNYPALDCFGVSVDSSSSVLGATLINGSWSFLDDVTVRVTRQESQSLVRLEVRHAHDPLRDSRAFVYSMSLRQPDFCLMSFSSYQVSLFQQGRLGCSSSTDEAAAHSDVVSAFISSPTKFVERRGTSWVFSSPLAESRIQTFDADIDVLIGIDMSASTPKYSILPSRVNPLQARLDLDARLMSVSCVPSSTVRPLQFRKLPPQGSLDIAPPDDVIQACAEACTTNSSSSLLSISSCVETCIESPDVGFRRQRILQSQNTQQQRTNAADEFMNIAFESSSSIMASLLAMKDLPTDQDERLRRCLVSGNQTSLAKPNVARLISILEALNGTLTTLRQNLEDLDSMMVTVSNIIFSTMADARSDFEQLSNLREKVMSALSLINAYSSRSSNALLASTLLNSFAANLDIIYEQLTRYFATSAWTGSSSSSNDILAAIQRIRMTRVNVIAIWVVVNRYLIPLLQARGSVADVNNIAWIAVAAMLRAANLYDQILTPFYELPHALAVLTRQETMDFLSTFNEKLAPMIDYLDTASEKLDIALSSQVTWTRLTTSPAQTSIPVIDACQYHMNHCLSSRTAVSCFTVVPGIVQSLIPPPADFNAENCPPSTRSCLVPSCEANVYVPTVTKRLETWLVRDALQTVGLRDDTVEDPIETALQGWGPMPVLAVDVPEAPEVSVTGLMLRLVDTYGAFNLPRSDILSCASNNFAETTTLCPPFDAITAVLLQYCNLPAGASCMTDSNCVSAPCIGQVCCAKGSESCTSFCVQPSGICYSSAPSRRPTKSPTRKPTVVVPTKKPTSASPTTSSPTRTNSPVRFTSAPVPRTAEPSSAPSQPTDSPTVAPTEIPTNAPSKHPTRLPTTGMPAPPPVAKTRSPTFAPTRKKKVTKSPTLKPTLQPTRQPTLSPPTKQPVTTTSPTSQPSSGPTRRPTLAPVSLACQRPQTSCESIASENACANWSGCLWNSETGTCYTLDCSEFNCRIKQYTFTSANALLPGCRLGDEISCDKQRQRVFSGLNLDKDCGATFLPFSKGGAWMGREQLQPVLSASSTDVFVSAGTGSDLNSGTRQAPFKTIERALVETRKATPGSNRRIILLPGVPFRLTNTVSLGPADSGLTLQGETFRATGARPRVTGTISLQGHVWQAMAGGIIRTALPDSIIPALDDLSALYIDDAPAIRARFPNLDNPLGFRYAASSTVSSWGRPKASASLSRRISRIVIPADDPNVKYHGKSIPYNRFSAGYGGACSHFDPPVSYFCEPSHQAQGGCPYTLPSSVTFSRNPFGSTRAWSNPSTAYFNTLHWYGWGLWTFRVKSQTTTNIVFDGGGWQEARGDCGLGGGNWYVENVIELLDYPNEFFLDLPNKYLYYYPDSPQRNPMLNSTIQVDLVTSLRRFIEVIGSSKTQPVTDITIRNLEFFGAHTTHMDAFMAPSGGDWTIHLGGAVHLEHVENSRIQGNFFVWCMGNALMMSKHIRNLDIEYNDFWAIGSTAIAMVGDPNYGSPEPWKISDWPEKIRVFGNVAAELGLVVKQSAATFVSIGAVTTVEQNVFFDGPRGGIVFNDGFGGGHVVTKNIVFQFVLETNDHGPFDTWDRQQYEEGVRPINSVDNNLFLGTAPGPKGIDFDDGTFNWISENNVVVWGYQKFKGSNVFARNNLILFPLASSCAFITPQNRMPANWSWMNNTCVSYRPAYAYNAGRAELTTLCNNPNFAADLNTYYYLGNDVTWASCTVGPLSWSDWRNRYGQDANSIFIRRSPSVSDMLAWTKTKLSWIDDILAT